MENAPDTIDALFDAFGKITVFSEKVDCGYEAARQMRRRKSIPVCYWPKVLEACEALGIPGVTYEVLVGMHTESAA